MQCPFCPEDVDPEDLLHALTCDGQQGRVEAEIEQEAELEDPVLLARGSDPETSHEAMAAYNLDRMRSAMACVVRLYRDRGPMADFELRVAFAEAWTAPCCDHLYQQARSAARDQGLIVATEERRVNPETGRRQVVWAYSEAAVPPVIRRCPACGHVLGRV